MQLSLIGINHQTAPLSIREKVAINKERLPDSLLLLRDYIKNGVILSTCNRTEIYIVTNSNGNAAEKATLDFLKAMLDIPYSQLLKYVYIFRDMEAVRHLFRVTSGLESMIVGEFEVLGQVRQALEIAEKADMSNLPLRHVFQSAIRTGRLVREQTGISRHALSVSSVAIDLASNIVGELKKCRILVIGTGDAGRLVAKVAKEKGVSEITIASRSKNRAKALASSLHGIPVDMNNLNNELHKVDIVVTCVGTSHKILGFHRIEKIMTNRPALPLVIVDIAIPRNVEPSVSNIKNVYLYNIDDLTGIAELNRQQRENEIHQADEIVTYEVDKFSCWWHDLKIRPIVSTLMSRADEIRLAQLNKTLKRLPPLSNEQRENLEAMTKSIVARILKEPIQFLKTNGDNRQTKLITELFNLKIDKHQ